MKKVFTFLQSKKARFRMKFSKIEEEKIS